MLFRSSCGLIVENVEFTEYKLNKEEEEERLSIIHLPQEDFCLYLYGGLLLLLFFLTQRNRSIF